MNCYDCATEDTTRAAIGICQDCGAGVCSGHAHLDTKYLTTIVPLGMHVAVEPPGRIIRCGTCADAEAAVRNGKHRRRTLRSVSRPA